MDKENHRKRLVVLGGGESGVGAAILGKDKGWDVFLSDHGNVAPRYAGMLDAENIEWEQGTHTADRIMDADLVVKSPGIPPTAPIVRALAVKGTPILSEIEFAGRYMTGEKTICITGSNGKTTTTLLTHHLLRGAGIDASLAGNVGNSLALQVARDPHPVYVIELSSFQLENMYDFRADIAVMLNITPDHLDRYDYRFENYAAAKFRILRNLTSSQAFVYWSGDPVITSMLAERGTPAALYPFDSVPAAGAGAWTDGGTLYIGTPQTKVEMPRDMLRLPGLHNLYNSMAAGLAAALAGASADDIRRGLGDFGGVEHRLEPAGEVDGARYINDSKATNVNSTWYALESMPSTRTTVLILGGKDKGNDYTEIEPLAREKVKAIVCMGVDNRKLLDFWAGKVPVVADTHSLDDALAECRRLASPGDTVLLSPCCASFDLFTSYENRGKLFKEGVAHMAAIR